jgi:hypothetical protein
MQDFTLFGIPIGRLGFFQSLIISVAMGFMSFFGLTFLSIIGVAIYKGISGSPITLAISYKYIAFPASILVLLLSLAFLMALWVRRKRLGY